MMAVMNSYYEQWRHPQSAVSPLFAHRYLWLRTTLDLPSSASEVRIMAHLASMRRRRLRCAGCGGVEHILDTRVRGAQLLQPDAERCAGNRAALNLLLYFCAGSNNEATLRAAVVHCLPASYYKSRPPCYRLLQRGVCVWSRPEDEQWPLQHDLSLLTGMAGDNTMSARLEADVDVADAELEPPQQQAPQMRQERPAGPARRGAIAAAAPAVAAVGAVVIAAAVVAAIPVAAAVPASPGAALPCMHCRSSGTSMKLCCWCVANHAHDECRETRGRSYTAAACASLGAVNVSAMCQTPQHCCSMLASP